MRLHRIKVTNLNSLYGTQEVNLEEDLGGAPLFLIQGPTGSGKSTLMDAVSLALFGTTPRLMSAGVNAGSDIAEHVMSRGTGECEATVEFSMRDDQGARARYLVTWSTYRARKKPDGRVQKVNRSIQVRGATGEWEDRVSNHRGSVTKPFFDELLQGFTADDFQRSMLLAQGEFDALLHADINQRASILERLTKTDEYKVLGARAARLNSAWKARQKHLQGRLSALTPVEPEVLQAAKEAVGTGEAREAQHEALISALRGREQWLSSAIKLVDSQSAARDRLRAATDAQALATLRLAPLAEHERCAAALVALDQHQESTDRHHREQRELHASQGGVPAATAAVAHTKALAEATAQRHEQSREALEALRAPVQLASRAAEKLAAAEAEVSKAADHAAASQEALNSEVSASKLATAALTRAEQAAHHAAETLDELASHAPLLLHAEAITRQCNSLAEEADRAAGQAAEAEVGRAALAGDRERHEAELAAHQRARSERLAPLTAALDKARAQLTERCGARPAAVVLDELVAQQEGLRVQLTNQSAAQIALDRWWEAREEMRESAQRHDVAEAALAGATTTVSNASAAVSAAEATHREAHGVLAPLERIAQHEAERRELVPGEPCPLCGSDSHPYRDGAAGSAMSDAVAAELAAARATLASAREAEAAANQALTQAQIDLGLAQGAIKSAAGQASTLAAKAEQLAEAALLAAAPCATEAAGVLDLAEERASIPSAKEATSANLRELGDSITALRQAQSDQQSAKDALAEAKDALAEEDQRLVTQAATLQERELQVSALAAAAATAQKQLSERRATLAKLLAEHGVQANPPERALPEVVGRVEAYRAATRSKEQALGAVEVATTNAEQCKRSAEQAQVAATKAAAALVERQERQAEAAGLAQTAREALATLWRAACDLDRPADPSRPHDGAPPAELLASQTAQVAALWAEHSNAQAAVKTAETALATLLAKIEAQQASVSRLLAEQQEAARTLDAALAQLAIPSAAALAERRLTGPQLDQLRALRQEHTEAVLRAEAAATSIAEQLTAHLRTLPESLPSAWRAEPPEAPTLRAALAEAEAALGTEKAAFDDTRTALEAARRITHAAASQEVAIAAAQTAYDEATKSASVWERLHELIGKNDGQAFQNFAQALNLSRLLVSANHHLASLSERYRLVPRLDPSSSLPTLEFDISDSHFPDAPRPTKTLSGGESFLVSLALALGLSDLRDSSMPVETLLLDEGFGTLDPDTLEIALQTLGQLQASGRQVGIISHVVGLGERIPARITVEPLGNGRSRVRTSSGS